MTRTPNAPWTRKDLPKPNPNLQLTLSGYVRKGSLQNPQPSSTAPRVSA